jgi:hypothetical protein
MLLWSEWLMCDNYEPTEKEILLIIQDLNKRLQIDDIE